MFLFIKSDKSSTKPLLFKYSIHNAYLVSAAVFCLPSFFFFFFMKHGYKRV